MVASYGDALVTDLPRSLFDSRQWPERQRYEAWRDSISVVFDYSLLPGIAEDQFFATIDNTLFADAFILSSFHAQAARYRRDAARIAADGLDMVMLQFALEGPCLLVQGKHERQCQVGDVIVMDATQPILNRNARERNVTLSVSRQLLGARVTGIEDAHLSVLAAQTPMAVMLRSHLLGLLAGIQRQSLAETVVLVNQTLALAAATIQTALGGTVDDSASLRSALRGRAIQLIEQGLQRADFSVAELAAALACSRSRLYALFEGDGGVLRYIQRRRLQLAASRLMSRRYQHLSIAGIAYACGFVNMSSFSRAFKATFGLSPRDLRNQCHEQDAGTEQGLLGRGVQSRRYEAWVRERLRSQ